MGIYHPTRTFLVESGISRSTWEISAYGVGRFPVTLYYEQGIRLLDAVRDLRAFLEKDRAG
jgi:hypothetical protein